MPDDGKTEHYTKLRVEVDGRSKAIVVCFQVRQTKANEPRKTPTPRMDLSPPMLKILSRDRNAFECVWTDISLRSREGVQYAVEICTMGADRWDLYASQRPSLDGTGNPTSKIRTSSENLLSVKNEWREVWRGADRAAVVKGQFYGALVRVRRLFANPGAASQVRQHKKM